MEDTDPIRIVVAAGDDEIRAAFPVLRQLREHLGSADELLERVRRQEREGYRLLCACSGQRVVGCAGFRRLESLFAGPYLYVDDLVTCEGSRSAGVGRALLGFLRDLCRAEGRTELHLDSGVQRRDAHRFYHREGLTIRSFHFKEEV